MSFLKASFSAKSYFPAVWFAQADESGVIDELRPEYRGGSGRMLPARDPFSDATEADIERLVIEKWEAIDAAHGVEEIAVSETQGVLPSIGDTQTEDLVQEIPARSAPLPMLGAKIQRKSLASATVPRPAKDPSIDLAAALVARRTNEEALLLILAEA